MSVIARGQITLVDLNDIITQPTPPDKPKEDMLWMNTGVNPPVLMIYKGGQWIKQDDFTETEEYKTITTTLKKNTSEIQTLKNEIDLKVSQTEVVNTVNTAINKTETKFNESISDINISLDGITNTVSRVESNVSTIDGKVDTLNTKMSAVEQKVTPDAIVNTVKTSQTNGKNTFVQTSTWEQKNDEIVATFKSSGGYNILRNGKATLDTSFWANNGGGISRSTDNIYKTCFKTSLPSGIKYSGGDSDGSIRLKNNTHYVYEAMIKSSTAISGGSTIPLHFWCGATAATAGLSQCSIVDYQQAVPKTNTWTKCYVHILTKASGEVWFTPFIYTGGSLTGDIWVTEISLSESSISLPYTPHPNEVYDGIVSIDKNGVTVSASNVNSKTNMSANGFKITKVRENEDVFKVDQNGELNIKGKITVVSGSQVPTNVLQGTISNSQLATDIKNDIATGVNASSVATAAQNAATAAQNTANTANTNATSAQNTANSANTKATNAENTANSVKNTVDSNSTKWTQAYDNVKRWAYNGATTGSTTINGGLIQTNTIVADKIAVGDFNNYALVSPDNLMGNWTVENIANSNEKWLVQKNVNRDTIISKWYTCKGGETFRLSADIYTNAKGSPTNSTNAPEFRGVAIGIFSESATGKKYYQFASRVTNSTGTSSGTVTLNSDAIKFAIYIQFDAYPTYSGTIKIKNATVNRMSNGELIVDGSITTNKITANGISAQVIKTGILQSTNSKSRINLDNGNFNLGSTSDSTYLKYESGTLEIKGKMVFASGTTFPDEVQNSNLTNSISESLSAANNALGLIRPLQDTVNNWSSVSNGTTLIDGGKILTGSIKANTLDVKGLTVRHSTKNYVTFAISAEGDVSVDGKLQSSNYSSDLGYSITTDGNAIFNQATVRGDIILPQAGMTNFGGQIGNENIALKTNQGTTGWGWGLQSGGKTISEVVEDGIRCCKLTRDNVASTGWSYISYSHINRSVYKPNTKYTVSFDVKASTSTQLNIILRRGNSSDPLTNEAKTVNLNTNDWTKCSVTLTTLATLPATSDQVLYITGMDSSPGSTYVFKNLKIELGTEATPWCPAKAEQTGDNIRIWAGATYSGRDNAPFRVNQNGELFASKGTFSGKVVSEEVNIGKIHLHDNAIVIDNSIATLDEDGQIYRIQPRHDSGNPHIKLDPSLAQFNVDVNLGNKIKYKHSDNKLLMNGATLELAGPQALSKITYNPGEGVTSGLNFFATTNGGQHVIRHSGAADNIGALIFDNEGVRGTKGDFVFTQGNFNGQAKVHIDGEANIKEKITNTKNNIEQRYTSKGIFFYAG